MTHPASSPATGGRFVVYYPKTGVRRRFHDHAQFDDYLAKIDHWGALITWPTSHEAHAVFPSVLQEAA